MAARTNITSIINDRRSLVGIQTGMRVLLLFFVQPYILLHLGSNLKFALIHHHTKNPCSIHLHEVGLEVLQVEAKVEVVLGMGANVMLLLLYLLPHESDSLRIVVHNLCIEYRIVSQHVLLMPLLQSEIPPLFRLS